MPAARVHAAKALIRAAPSPFPQARLPRTVRPLPQAAYGHAFPKAREAADPAPAADAPIQRVTTVSHTMGTFRYGPAPGDVEQVGVKATAYLDPTDPHMGSTPASQSAQEGQGPMYAALRHTWPQAHWKRGHLLNGQVGGLGVKENLYPITTAANGQHATQVETWLKDWARRADAQLGTPDDRWFSSIRGSGPWSAAFGHRLQATYTVDVDGQHNIHHPDAVLRCRLTTSFGTYDGKVHSEPGGMPRGWTEMLHATGDYAGAPPQNSNVLPPGYGEAGSGLGGGERRPLGWTNPRWLWAMAGYNVHEIVDAPGGRTLATAFW